MALNIVKNLIKKLLNLNLKVKTPMYNGIKFNKYIITSKSEIYRIDEEGRFSDKPLKQWDNQMGYLCVDLMDDFNNKVRVKIHRCMAETFLVKPNNIKYLIVNHKDGNKHNNELDNIEYVSQRYNVEHAQKLIKGKDYLSGEALDEIRELIDSGMPINEIANKLNINYHVIIDIKRGKTYNSYDI